MTDDIKPVFVNGVDITQVEGANVKTKSDIWYHEIEMEMIGKNDEKTSQELINFLNERNYKLPTLNLNQLIQNVLKNKQ